MLPNEAKSGVFPFDAGGCDGIGAFGAARPAELRAGRRSAAASGPGKPDHETNLERVFPHPILRVARKWRGASRPLAPSRALDGAAGGVDLSRGGARPLRPRFG
ncbi:MAG: hypothetical protein GVY33_09425 [Alphaproteobacteria bacterium]|nr:hypothetical protein [Alphaproteobacteria bacterium]